MQVMGPALHAKLFAAQESNVQQVMNYFAVSVSLSFKFFNVLSLELNEEVSMLWWPAGT